MPSPLSQHPQSSWQRSAKSVAIFLGGLACRCIEAIQPKYIVVYYVWPDFSRKAKGIADILRKKGFRVRIRHGNTLLNRIRVKSSKNLHIGFWNEFYFGYLPSRYIFFNAEPLGIARWREDKEWFNAMSNALEIWGYNHQHEKYIIPLKVPFYYVPFGYASYYETQFQTHTKDKNLTKDIDVFFAGGASERRKKIVAQLRNLGINVYNATYQNPAYDEALDELLARSKIVLTIFKLEDPETHNADFARIDHLLSNRIFVIHEKLSDLTPDKEFEENVITCNYEKIVATCQYYLDHDNERKIIADRAYFWFKEKRALEHLILSDNIYRYYMNK